MLLKQSLSVICRFTLPRVSADTWIPIDPFYLTWKARKYNQMPRFIELTGEINSKSPEHVINRVGEALNSCGKSVKGCRVLIWITVQRKC
jgi:UDP-N-acetyl-D-mannosaminuronate dehydrogenase